MFSINYSTAKTLMRQYKFNTLPFDVTHDQEDPPLPLPLTSGKEALLRCGYRDIASEQNSDDCKKEVDMSMEYPSF